MAGSSTNPVYISLPTSSRSSHHESKSIQRFTLRSFLSSRFLIILLLVPGVFLIIIYFATSTGLDFDISQFPFLHSSNKLCTAEDWSSGRWKPRKPLKGSATNGVFGQLGFEGCASGIDVEGHLGLNSDGSNPLPGRANFEWVPGKGCRVRKFKKERLVRQLVEIGGWFLVGGQSYFTLSVLPNPRPEYELTRLSSTSRRDIRKPLFLTLLHALSACRPYFSIVHFKPNDIPSRHNDKPRSLSISHIVIVSLAPVS